MIFHFLVNKKKLLNNIKEILNKKLGFIDFLIIILVSNKIIGFKFFINVLYNIFNLGIGCFYKILSNNFFYSLKNNLDKFDQFYLTFVFKFWDIKLKS